VLKQLSKEVASSGFQAVRPEMFQPYILQKSNNIKPYLHRKTAFASFFNLKILKIWRNVFKFSPFFDRLGNHFFVLKGAKFRKI
jgi:hypothetical protein